MSKIPEEIGKYKILSCLGSGGTSIVYTATHPTLKRKVVLKKLNLRGNKQHYERFRQEAALMMDLNHDNIVRVFDHFKEGTRHYIVMEFVEGCSLDEVLRKGGALPPGACRLILESCCKAIEYIHSRNIIHRDIKPSNIFISRSGDVKLGDFGIAELEREGETNGESLPIGTPSYMAPEQFLPHGKITKKTDIYALGVSLYEMLTAEKLFTGSTLDDLKRKILKSRHDPLFPLIFSKGFPLYWIVRKSCFRSPSLRFANIKSLRRVLKFATPKVRNHDARAVLQLLVESAAGVKKSGKKKKESQPVLPESKRIGRRGKILWFSLAIVLVLGALLSYSIMNGSFYRLFFQKKKGAVQIHVLSRNIIFPHVGDLHLYRDKSLYLDSVKEVDLSGGIGISDIYYLDTGNYRIMVRWGSQVEWILFYLPPMAQQEGVMVVDVQREDIPRKPLAIQSYLTDALNGRDLSAESVVSVQKNGVEWVPIDDLFLMTGEAYRMKVECKGYYPRFLNVPIQFYQDLLVLRIQMVPLPGILSIDHDMKDFSLLVDGKKRITGGSEEKELLQFGRIPAGRQEWMLSPGVYKLRFQSEGAVLETELMVDSFGKYHYTLQLQNDKLIMTPY